MREPIREQNTIAVISIPMVGHTLGVIALVSWDVCSYLTGQSMILLCLNRFPENQDGASRAMVCFLLLQRVKHDSSMS